MICIKCGFAAHPNDDTCSKCHFIFHDVDYDHSTNIRASICKSCHIPLDIRPTIKINEPESNGSYCYTCAKITVEGLEKKYLSESKNNFKKEAIIYRNKKDAMQNWLELRGKYKIRKNIELLFFAHTPISFLIFIFTDSSTYPILFFTLGILYIFSFREINYNDFIAKNKKPDAPSFFPPKIFIKKASHFCVKHDFHKKNTGYRKKILDRDEYVCQWCLEENTSDNLEVHHIITRSNGGNNHPANLITLCIPCHKKEDWYGHYHKYKNR